MAPKVETEGETGFDDPWGLAQGCGKMTRENSWLSRKYALFFFAFCTCYFHSVVERVLASFAKNGNICWIQIYQPVFL